jgi:hypothetical protein
MSFDEEARQSAEALAAHLGREIQDRLQEFVSHLATAASDERQSLADQAQQAVAASERTLDAAVARAREEVTAELTARFEAEQAERDAAQAERDAAQAERDAAQADRDAAQAEREAAQAERHAAIERQALERQTIERETMLAAMERLVTGFRRLDEGESLSQLLDVLAAESARETPRSAVFVVRGRNLQGWSFSGFEAAPHEPRSVTFGLDVIPDFERVVDQGSRSEVHHTAFNGDDSGPLNFISLRSEDVGVAVPVIVGGQVAALVYADDGADLDRPVPASWPEAIELLARHAARCLEAQTAIRAARLSNGGAQSAQSVRSVVGSAATAVVASTADSTYAEEHARRYARLLIADVRLKNEAAVRLGRESHDLWRRLQPEITAAREAFNERVSPSLLQRDRIFEEELVRTLADGDDSLFGFPPPGSSPEGSESERLAV